MKTVITSQGNNVDAIFDQRFGRAAWFCVFDEEAQTTEFVKNENADAPGGAGTKSGETMAALAAQKVVSGHYGPKAKELLERLGVQMVIFDGEGKTIKEIIETLKG